MKLLADFLPIILFFAAFKYADGNKEWAAAFAAELGRIGLPLILRRGPALAVLDQLVAETGAGGVWWSRLYDPASVARDTGVKAAQKAKGLEARSFAGHLLHEPWTVETGLGGFYRVFTPYWRAVRTRDVAAPESAPSRARGLGVGAEVDPIGFLNAVEAGPAALEQSSAAAASATLVLSSLKTVWGPSATSS